MEANYKSFFSLLPSSSKEIDLKENAAVCQAQDICDELDLDNAIEIISDNELLRDVVTLCTSEVPLAFSCKTNLNYLVMMIKNISEYFRYELVIIDDMKKYRTFIASNSVSVARIKEKECQLPINCINGWNYICMDLNQLVQTAFGTNYKKAFRLQIIGNCKVFKVFFQSKRFSQVELPNHLKLRIVEEDEE